jgi:hypothetical protein
MVSEALLGEGYQWGEEAFGLKAGGPSNPTPDLNDHDCSGHVYSVYWLASEWSHEFGFGYIKSKGGANHLPRSTAHGFIATAVKIGRDPSKARCGDVVGFWRPLFAGVGHITLVGRMKNGVRMSQEARGEKWGVVQYPLASVLARSSRAYIYRFPWLNLGEQGLAPPIVIPPQVKRGDKGPYVSQLQAALNKLGYKPALVVDGVFGWKTYAAVLWAQKKFGVWQIGICGPKTWAAILAAVAKL